ncbi:hypothetical protein CROQUDRAFT_456312 [Cronartium quercuum f. sp. fusiforme G11]|uniref:Uncharacterized protein n=1 Tax=Cronartium quercuum f. sp. fusiforme G11 TaxID=708437 RepID=A0A9P6NP31_9BASI|nr:hypothetical protein CROQUDRAFT_456312 [Cronartium quercuum f. sp. fusiforme G11]
MERKGGTQPDAGHCNPLSIDEFLSTFIVGPSPANGFTGSESEPGQLGGERTGGGGLGWGLAQDRYYGMDIGQETRFLNPESVMSSWTGFAAPDMGSAAASMMTEGMGERMSHGENIEPLREGRSDATPTPTRQQERHLNQFLSSHPGSGLSLDLFAARNFTAPAPNSISHSVALPDSVSLNPTVNRCYVNQPLPSFSGTYPAFLTASSTSFESESPPYSAPPGSGFSSLKNPFGPHLPPSGSQSSTCTNSTSRLGLGGGPHQSYASHAERSGDHSDPVFGLSSGLAPSSISSAASTSFSSDSFDLSSSNTPAVYSPWKQDW